MLLLTACSTGTGSTDKIIIAPSAEFYELACKIVGTDPAELAKRIFSFQADTTLMVFGGIYDDVRNKDLSYLYSIDADGYFQYFNSHNTVVKTPRLRIQEITVFVGSGGVTAEEAPVFIIELKAMRRNGSTLVVSKAAKGPAYSSFSLWDVRTSEIAKRSENIAFFAAFLRVIDALETQNRGLKQ